MLLTPPSGQPMIVAHHYLARKGGLILALDGEKALQRAQGGLVIANSADTPHVGHLPHLSMGKHQK